MNRLTTKIKGLNNYCEFELKNAKYKDLFELSSNREIENYVNADLTIAVDKLGQLEDIEEELGIDLITLFKALKQGGVYVKEGNKVDWSTKMHGFQISGISNSITLWSQVRLEPKDYGKTWALTKEELEGDN